MIALTQRDSIFAWNANIGLIHLIPAILRRYLEIIVLQSSGTGIHHYKFGYLLVFFSWERVVRPICLPVSLEYLGIRYRINIISQVPQPDIIHENLVWTL